MESVRKSTGEDKRYLAEKVEKVRKAVDGMGKQARGEDVQRVAELEEESKKLKGEMRPRSIDEQDVMRDLQEECEEKITREGRGETCGRGKGKRNGEKGEHASRRGKFRGKGAATMANDDDEGEEADDEKESTRGFARMCVDPVLCVRVDLGADLSGWLRGRPRTP